MQPATLFMLQAMMGTGFDNFDLRKVEPPPDADAIVVTGRRESRRLKDLPEDHEEQLVPRAEIKAGKGTLKTHIGRRDFNGAVSNRAMLTLTLPF